MCAEKEPNEKPEGKISKAIRWTIGVLLIGLAFWIGIHIPMTTWDRLRR